MADYVAGVMEGASSMLTVFKWGAIGFGIILFISVIGFWFIRRKQYVYTCEIWGMKGGVPDTILTDKARQVKIYAKEGVASLLYFKKLKKYIKIPERDFFIGNKIRFWFRKDGDLTAIKTKEAGVFEENKPGKIKVGKKEIELQDNFYIPLVMEDINQKFAVMNVQYIDEDMRLAHKSTSKIVADMFNIHNWLKEYGHTILIVIAFLILILGAILWMDSVKDYYGAGDSVSKVSEESSQRMVQLNEKMTALIERIDTKVRAWDSNT
jgi:hypothetical protein